MAEMGPMLKALIRAFGANPNADRRPAVVDAAVDAAQAPVAPAPNPPAPPPAMFRTPGAPVSVDQLTPEQKSDWQAVGLGQMKLGEFRAKHGFLPQ